MNSEKEDIQSPNILCSYQNGLYTGVLKETYYNQILEFSNCHWRLLKNLQKLFIGILISLILFYLTFFHVHWLIYLFFKCSGMLLLISLYNYFILYQQ